MKKLDKRARDALRELASISSGSATTVLSDLIDKPVKLTMSNITLVPIKDITKLIGGPKKMIVGVYTPVAGDVSGNMMLIFGKEEALILSDLIQKKELGMTETLKTKDQQKLIEAGNLLSTAYLNAFNDFLGIKTTHLNARFISTFGESVTDFILLGVKKELRDALLLETNFTIGPPKVEGHFVLLLALESIDVLLELIKTKLKEAK